MKIVKLLIVFVLTFSCTQCKKYKSYDVTPEIGTAIKKFDKESGCPTARVDEYTFRSKTVYTFNPGNCGADMTTRVTDEKDNTLGHLGGFAGNTKINGEEFSNAKFVRNVWLK